jgi:hypothetical protein
MKTKKTSSLRTGGSSLVVLAALLVTLFISSCSTDEETAPDTSPLFLGTYSVEDISHTSGHVYNYDITISPSASGLIQISNFADIFNVPIKASVHDMNFTIAAQSFTNPSGKTITVSGSGTLLGNVLTFSYTTSGYLNYTGNCQAVKNN